VSVGEKITDLWEEVDPTLCPVCGRESCEDHLPGEVGVPAGISEAELEDAVDVAQEGRKIAADGIRYVLDDIIPDYGVLGFLVAFAKVGKTTFGQDLAAHVAMGREFLGRRTSQRPVLVLAAEDPPEYTAYLARHLDVAPGWLKFHRRSHILNEDGVEQICETVRRDRFGLVLIASWQAVVCGLVRDENDNAASVQIVERVKAATRLTGVPWLIDAHSGKNEDQADGADPSKAMRGASAMAGAADYTLSLRYAKGAFATQRRLSGKGRFVSFAPLTLNYNPETGAYSTGSCSASEVGRETTLRLIRDTGALDGQPRGATEIARQIFDVREPAKVSGAQRRQVQNALHNRPDVGIVEAIRRGQKTRLYQWLKDTP
jgi:hypothetical protein